MGDGVTLVSSAEECAKDVYRMLVEHGIERSAGEQPVHRFLTTGSRGSRDHRASVPRTRLDAVPSPPAVRG